MPSQLTEQSMRGDYSTLRPNKPVPEITTPLKVGIVATPSYTLMSLSCFTEFLRLAADEVDFSRQLYCSWDLLSHNKEPLVSSCGFALTPTKHFSDTRDYDYIVVQGGTLHGKEPVPDALYEFIRTAVETGVKVVGLCTGQFVLAELGYLSKRRCAVHFSLVETLKNHFPQVTAVTDAAVVVDGTFITCPGGLAAINLAMHLVTEHCGKTRSHKALHYLMADRGFEEIQTLRQGSDLVFHCTDRRVGNAVEFMRRNIFGHSSLAELAEAVGATERELTRLFRKHLSASPADYWRTIRLTSARWIVINSDRPIGQNAYACGFADSAHLIEWFKRTYGITPAKLRRDHVDLGFIRSLRFRLRFRSLRFRSLRFRSLRVFRR
jgi:transcriptional regulator GlxA family with amidase domain